MSWYRDIVRRAVDPVHGVPREKLVIGIGNYAYDWMDGRDWAEPLTYQGALVNAIDFRQHEKPEDIVDFDDETLNPTFRYQDDDLKWHEVWMLDAVTAANQWLIAQNYSVRGMAIWVLGSADPSIWKFIDRDHLNQRPKMKELEKVQFPFDVEFVGEGEIAHVDKNPTPGSRSLEIDVQTGLALDESYHTFPTSYVISRTGYKPKMIALTIDDGPADPYTAEILDELKALHVPATFFLIGQNAERYPGLVRRIWAEGHEIGNHTYTHPNIAVIPEQEARLQLNATRRVLESLLHRSTLLFRPPYNADAEPTADFEVTPIKLASSLNYITVLEYIDSQDWNTAERMPDGSIHHRKAEDMWLTVLQQLEGGERGSCILLHDAGGDRAETVRLIPILVNELHKRGYRFVPVSALIDSDRKTVNPPVASADTLMLANDRIVFEAIYLFELFLGIAFVTAIILGTLRVVFVIILALIAKWRERYETFDATYRPAVSVVIAAFNEETVIVNTIRAVLANGYAPLEIIVVDDGSSDDTSGQVRANFGDTVTLLAQPNGGKASALNLGIAVATAEIIIALDADTVFARDTIEKLVRHFTNPLVGAVAGNVKVGNRVNPLTHWQSIEYVTSQNLDRRAYATINSVTVVPGAVGAWRREAILQAGRYTTDTMAEDMDLTWRIRRIGWRIETESSAMGYTEAPDSIRALFKQRFRWAFGTLQALWKHRRAAGPLRLVRPRDAADALALPGRVSGSIAAGRPADPLVDRDRRPRLDARSSRRRLAAASERALLALPHRLHVRVLLRRRAGRIAGRVQARSRRPTPAGLALLAALPLSPADVRRRSQVDQDRHLRHSHRLGKARAQGHGRDARRDDQRDTGTAGARGAVTIAARLAASASPPSVPIDVREKCLDVFGPVGRFVVEQVGVLPDVHHQQRDEAGHVAALMQLDPVIRDASGGRIEIGDGPADTAHLADADEIRLPDVEAREAPLHRSAKARSFRRFAAAVTLHVAEVVLVQDHPVVLEAEAARQLRIGRHLLLVDLAVGEDGSRSSR